MPSKDKVSVTARITENDYKRLESIATLENITVSALLKLCVDGILSGDIEVEKGELKIGVDPIGYAVSDDFEDSFSRRVEQRFDVLREREYPEEYIEAMKDEIINGIESRVGMLPKRFDKRKIKDSECGC